MKSVALRMVSAAMTHLSSFPRSTTTSSSRWTAAVTTRRLCVDIQTCFPLRWLKSFCSSLRGQTAGKSYFPPRAVPRMISSAHDGAGVLQQVVYALCQLTTGAVWHQQPFACLLHPAASVFVFKGTEGSFQSLSPPSTSSLSPPPALTSRCEQML